MAIDLMTMTTCQDVSGRSSHGNLFTFLLDFQNKFSAIHQEYSVNKSRELKSKAAQLSIYHVSDSTPVHFTSVTDTRRTATIIQRGEYGGPVICCRPDEMCVRSARDHHHSQFEEHTAHVKLHVSLHFMALFPVFEFVLGRGLRIS